MSRNFVHRNERTRILFATAHTAGDLVYCKGFYGVVQDDVTAGSWGVLLHQDVWELARTPATVAMGTKLYAPATEIATSLLLSATTTGGNPVGRVTATGNATVARVRLFGDNAY